MSSVDYTDSNNRGHSLERFQGPQFAQPVNFDGAAIDLKSAAGTTLGKWHCPPMLDAIQIIGFGFTYSAAGGAQTTAGSVELEIDGVNVEVPDPASPGSTTVALAASEASHLQGDGEFTDLNQTENLLKLPPTFPELSPGEVLEMKVNTQGAGAGSQTVFPYIVWRIKP